MLTDEIMKCEQCATIEGRGQILFHSMGFEEIKMGY